MRVAVAIAIVVEVERRTSRVLCGVGPEIVRHAEVVVVVPLVLGVDARKLGAIGYLDDHVWRIVPEVGPVVRVVVSSHRLENDLSCSDLAERIGVGRVSPC